MLSPAGNLSHGLGSRLHPQLTALQVDTPNRLQAGQEELGLTCSSLKTFDDRAPVAPDRSLVPVWLYGRVAADPGDLLAHQLHCVGQVTAKSTTASESAGRDRSVPQRG